MNDSLTLQRLPGAFGVEILGVDLSQAPSPTVVDAIESAFVEHHLVVFRGQRLNPASQVAFGSRFGTLEDYPFVAPLVDHPKVIPVIKEADEDSNFGGGWHSDLIYRGMPPMATMLYALEVPVHGGDTMFADGILAFANLSAGMQSMLSTLGVEYNVRHIQRDLAMRGGSGTGNRSMPSQSAPDVLAETPVHPLIRTHPDGRKGIYLSREHTIRFDGMTPRESAPLLDWLQTHLTEPRHTTRLQWQAGTLAFWDNRCLNHYALNDYPGERRHMHRLTIAGDVPR